MTTTTQQQRVRETCAKCSGTGSISWGIDVNAVVDGRTVSKVCFDCKGVGYRTVTQRTIRDRARRAEKARREAEEREARLRVEKAAWLGDNSDLVDALAPWGSSGTRRYPQALVAVAVTLEQFGWLNAEDTETARTELAQIAEKEATEIEVPEGRRTVEGEVVTVKWQDNAYGGNLKMLVQAEGYRLWGTVPRAIDDVERGDRVQFTATLTAKERGFGFYSRPSKATIVTHEEEVN
jgi:hypothetical protein